ncbi:glycosyltransferase [Fibrella sp. HMF5335]|uniref:Glycosyltransferase n=1 Tax=Fibrella rubiginis TaxID=2817060 RepID=A0A939K4Y3_9BACT|nr:nucleotide disphospho-sugar-binding domain-containing protein [Fibrella rubiginis]MBO0935875.1 glycosyltransferase [Fibrella rubiginis]
MNSQRILFATMPMDGHFSPLTGLAVHLHQLGHDVRWYVGGDYGERVKDLGLHHYPFVRAKTVNQENLDSVFPDRSRLKNTIARLRFDINEVFLLRAPEFVDDLKAIHADWPFDLIIHDVAFIGGSFIQQLLSVKSVAVGVIPLAESDEWVGPSGMGMPPRAGFIGRQYQRFLRYMVQHVLFKPCNDLHNQLRAGQGLPPVSDFMFDYLVRSADLYLQSGVPGFEYPRRRISPTVRFVGPLLPFSSGKRRSFDQAGKVLSYTKVVLVTQGTVERDVEKLLVPTLEAFQDDPTTLVIATTGGAQTEELRDRFPHDNFIIDDFIPFNAVMPYADVYVTNGGYGGVMLALQNNLPIMVAGVHEGKNEIAARIGYCQVGINLKTETPKPAQIRQAVGTLLTDPGYRQNVRRLGRELSQYNANKLAEQHIHDLLEKQALVAV